MNGPASVEAGLLFVARLIGEEHIIAQPSRSLYVTNTRMAPSIEPFSSLLTGTNRVSSHFHLRRPNPSNLNGEVDWIRLHKLLVQN